MQPGAPCRASRELSSIARPVSRALRLQSVDARFDGDLGRFTAHAVVSGDTLLTVTLESGNHAETTRVPLRHPIVLPSLLPLRLAFGRELRPGRTDTISVFDPFLLSERPVTVKVAAESTFVVADSAAYDSTAIPRVKGKRREIRRMLAQRSNELLAHYRLDKAVPEGCQLQLALSSGPSDPDSRAEVS